MAQASNTMNQQGELERADESPAEQETTGPAAATTEPAASGSAPTAEQLVAATPTTMERFLPALGALGVLLVLVFLVRRRRAAARLVETVVDAVADAVGDGADPLDELFGGSAAA